MSSIIIIFWKDIPAQVNGKSGKESIKRQLSNRFQEAIDLAAMHSNCHESDTYLKFWRRSEPIICGGDLNYQIKTLITKLEIDYSEEKLKILSNAGGIALESN